MNFAKIFKMTLLNDFKILKLFYIIEKNKIYFKILK